MREQLKSFRELICHIYIIFLMAGLPLFMGKGYFLLGDTKYVFFRNGTCFCLGIWLLILPFAIYSERKSYKLKCSVMDGCVLAYGMISLISAVCSNYRQTAMLGYRDWYMGALSQLLLVGIYFFISREYSYQKYSLLIGEIAVLVVLGIAFLQKLELDFFRLMHLYNNGDWEYSHMLSTIGNINWFCGYLGLVLPFALTGYLYAKGKGKKYFLYIVSIAGLAMLWMNGSDSGIAMCVLSFFCCFVFCLFHTEYFEKCLLLGIGVSVILPMFSYLVLWRKSTLTFPADGNVFLRINSPVWWVIALFLTVLFIGTVNVKKEKRKKWVQAVLYVMIGCFTFAGILSAMKFLPHLFSGNADWGNGRGTLWQLAWKQFLRCSRSEKFIGVGPDCYAYVVYTANVMEEGHWQGAVFANAHNEWLNQLVNMGLVGLAAYFSVFVTGFIRYRRILLGMMVIVIYMAIATFSFQEVMNAPYLFLVLGLCENRLRQQDSQR